MTDEAAAALSDFIDAARKWGAAADASRANREQLRLTTAYRCLCDAGPRTLQSSLLPLLESEDNAVRYAAAAHLLGIAPAAGESVLLELSEGPKGMLAAWAWTSLYVWRAGALDFGGPFKLSLHDVTVESVYFGVNWRLIDDEAPSMLDWVVEPSAIFSTGDTIVYSALARFTTGEVRPLLVVRELGSYGWWGDTCEYVSGQWRELGRGRESAEAEFVAAPHPEDPSFMGAYDHDVQRTGFMRWRNLLRGRESRNVRGAS